MPVLVKPNKSYSITMRLEIQNKVGMLGAVTRAFPPMEQATRRKRKKTAPRGGGNEGECQEKPIPGSHRDDHRDVADSL